MSEEESRTCRTSHNMPLEDPHTVVAKVAVRLLPFWPVNPRVWCVQVEVQFSRRGITTSTTKYEEIICALPMVHATEIQDLLLDLSEEEPYDKLKQQLIARIAYSERQKLRQLLTAEELGDCTPSQLLRKMQLLLGGKAKMIDSSLLREYLFATTPS